MADLYHRHVRPFALLFLFTVRFSKFINLIGFINSLACANSGRPHSIAELDCQLLLPSDDECWSNSLLYTETLNGTFSVRFNQVQTGQIIGSIFDNSKLPQSVRNDQASRPSLSLTAYLARAATLLARVTAYINRSKVRDLNIVNEKGSDLVALDESLDTLQAQLPDYFKFTDKTIEDFQHGTPAEFHTLVMVRFNLSTFT